MFKYDMNKSGPMTEPCGIPQEIFNPIQNIFSYIKIDSGIQLVLIQFGSSEIN